MTDNKKWTSYRTGDPVDTPAPPPDHLTEPLCALDDVADGEARSFETGAVDGVGAVIVARQGARVFGYANRCPHVGTPLDWVPDRLMDFSGRHLRCATHGATFRVEDGVCIAGPCEGDALRPVPLELRDGKVWLAVAKAAD